MSLYGYRRPRLVVLSSKNSVLEAARAMENNSIGAIMVQDNGRIVGIVTDRDLAVRAMVPGFFPGVGRRSRGLAGRSVSMTDA